MKQYYNYLKKCKIILLLVLLMTGSGAIGQTFTEVENNNTVENALAGSQARKYTPGNFEGTVSPTDSDFWVISRKAFQATQLKMFVDANFTTTNPFIDFRVWEYTGGDWGVSGAVVGTLLTSPRPNFFNFEIDLNYQNNLDGNGNSTNYYAIEVFTTSSTATNYSIAFEASSFHFNHCYEFGLTTLTATQVNDIDVALNDIGVSSFEDRYYVVKFSATNSFTDFTDHYIQDQSLPTAAASNSYSGSGEHIAYVGDDNGAVQAAMTMTGLQRNTTYYYKVYPYNNCQGYINYNNSIAPVAITTCPGTVPNAGTVNAVTATSPTSATINTLGRPAGAGATTGYLVKFSDTNSFTAPTTGTTIPTASTDYSGKTGEQVVYTGTIGSGAGTTDDINQVITGIQINKEYYTKVYTYDFCGGVYNFETTGSAVVTTNYVCEAPSAAANVDVTVAGPTTIDINSFTASASNSEGSVGYIIKVSDVNLFTTPTSVPGSPSTTYNVATGGEQVVYVGSSVTPNITISGLISNGTYYVKVYAYGTCAGNNYFEPTGSTLVSATTCGTPTGNSELNTFREDLHWETRVSPIISNVPAGVEGQVVKINTINSFTDITGSLNTLPTADVTYSGSGEQVILAGAHPEGQAFTAYNLLPNTQYFFKIYSYTECAGIYYFSNTSGEISTYTAGVTDKLASNAVINNFTGTSFTLDSFTGAPAADNGFGIPKGYIIKMNTVNSFSSYPFRANIANQSGNPNYLGGEQVMYIGTSVNPNLEITGLTPNAIYYFTIYAYTDSGTPYFFNSYQQIGYDFSITNNGSLLTTTITFDDLTVRQGDPSFNLNATSNSSATISYRIVNDGGTGTTLSGANNDVVTIGTVGTVIIEASQVATATYQSATKNMTLTIGNVAATINNGFFYTEGDGTTTIDLTTVITSNSTGAMSFEIIGDALGHSITGNILTASHIAGSFIIKVSQAADANYSATVAYAVATCFKQGFTPTDFAMNFFDFSLNPGETFIIQEALSFATEPITYTIVGADLGSTMVGKTFTAGSPGTVTLRATYPGQSFYNPLTKDITVTINGAPQTITFNALSDVAYGDAPFDLTATVSSGLPITYTSSDPSIASISGSTVTLHNEGSVTITASQVGDNTYFPADDVVQTLTIQPTAIVNQNVTVDSAGSALCTANATISLDNSQLGVDYYLRNNNDNSIIEGPIAGTGSEISFTSEMLTSDRTYNVLAVQDTQTLPSATNTLQMTSTPTAIVQTIQGKTINITQPDGQSAVVAVANSQTGVNYYLQDNVSNEILQGPLSGTGADVSFNSEAITADRTYKVTATDASANNGTRGALRLDNVDDYVSIAAINTQLINAQRATIETWVKIPASDATDVNASIISFEGYSSIFTNGTVVPLYINISGGTIFAGNYNSNPDDGGTFNTPGYTYPVDTWFHVAATVDNQSISFYVNGNLIGTNPLNTSFVFHQLISNIRLGRNYESASSPTTLFGGEITQTRIWNGIRTQQEIASNRNTKFTTPQTNLVLNYNYDQTSGTSVPDASGNSNTGTLQNGAGDDTNWVSDLVTDGVCGLVSMDNTVTATYSPADITLSPKVYLQGAITNPNSGEETLMRDDLRVAGTIPTTSPYSDALVIDAAVLNTTGANAILDWVWVELRDAGDASVFVEGTSALLQRDGDIVDVDGTSPVSFVLPADNYCIAIRHRNHLGVRSVNTYSLSANPTMIDFSSSSTVLQGGSNAVVDMGNGIFAIPVGDQDENGQVQNADINAVVQLLGSSGYNKADMDMNGQIQNTDINTLINPNLGRGEQF